MISECKFKELEVVVKFCEYFNVFHSVIMRRNWGAWPAPVYPLHSPSYLRHREFNPYSVTASNFEQNAHLLTSK